MEALVSHGGTTGSFLVASRGMSAWSLRIPRIDNVVVTLMLQGMY